MYRFQINSIKNKETDNIWKLTMTAIFSLQFLKFVIYFLQWISSSSESPHYKPKLYEGWLKIVTYLNQPRAHPTKHFKINIILTLIYFH